MHEAVSTPVAIVGNGLAGQVMALALKQAGIACTLIGPSATPDETDQRTTAIMAEGVAFLRMLNIWDETALRATPLRTMRLISDTATVAFDAGEIGLPEFGFNVSNAALHALLAGCIAAERTIRVIGTQVTDIDSTGPARARVICANGDTLDTPLVIGADGRHSRVRETAGIGVTQTVLDQQALVCVVASDWPHDFASTEWYHRGGPFTLVPMPDDEQDEHRMAVVFCDTAAELARLQNLTRADLGEFLTDFSTARFGSLRVTNDPQLWPIAPQRSAALVAHRVALIGEAAHVLPPLAAQGFNITLRDIAALQGIVRNAMSLGLDPGHASVLRAYQTARASDMRLRGTGVDLLNRFIRQDDRIGRMAHAFGFKALDGVPALKRFVMRRGLADTATTQRTGAAA